jgi:hypothetical protein
MVINRHSRATVEIGLILLLFLAPFVSVVSPTSAQTQSIIYGYVFLDANSNGIDKEDAILLGVPVTLDSEQQFLTDSFGSYMFLNVSTGSHTVEVIVPEGYVATTPIEVNINVTTENSYEFDFTSGNLYGVNFGVSPIQPVTGHNYDGGWHTHDFDIRLATRDAVAGVAETFYKINGGPVLHVTANGHPRITVEGDNNTLEYWSLDMAGNKESPRVLTGIKLDKTPPKIGNPSRIPEGNVQPNQMVKVAVNVTDSTSGVESVRLEYFINETTTGIEIPLTFNSTTSLYVSSLGIPGQSANTLVRYTVTAYDNAGNLEIKDNAEPYYVYTIIPEFSSFPILLLFMLATLLAVTIYRRKQS